MTTEDRVGPTPLALKLMPGFAVGAAVLACVSMGTRMGAWWYATCVAVMALGLALVYADSWCDRWAQIDRIAQLGGTTARHARRTLLLVQLGTLVGLVLYSTLALVCCIVAALTVTPPWH